MIAIGTKHVHDQRLRIERHKEFICKLERDGQPNVIAEARRLLCEMVQTLARTQADIRRAAQELLGSSTKREANIGLALDPIHFHRMASGSRH
jgi:hypothetical protein